MQRRHRNSRERGLAARAEQLAADLVEVDGDPVPSDGSVRGVLVLSSGGLRLDGEDRVFVSYLGDCGAWSAPGGVEDGTIIDEHSFTLPSPGEIDEPLPCQPAQRDVFDAVIDVLDASPTYQFDGSTLRLTADGSEIVFEDSAPQ